MADNNDNFVNDRALRDLAGRRVNDPPAPIRATPTAFFIFSRVEYENIKRENPGKSFIELGRIRAERWRNMSDEEKQRYERMTREFNAPSLSDLRYFNDN
ncbi:hypothetical protein RND81_02G008200 [Saponaria officinalis]|uniref:HMG box domain-containing protein n=1 Tax=Saponaria officinalis TaxID=3572 RepID=A0AAW1MIP4_SAPOF